MQPSRAVNTAEEGRALTYCLSKTQQLSFIRLGLFGQHQFIIEVISFNYDYFLDILVLFIYLHPCLFGLLI